MSEKRINYICVYCGKRARRRVSHGEPLEEICSKRDDNGLHVWINSQEVNKECRIKMQEAKYPIAEYMYYKAGSYVENANLQNIEKAISLYHKAAELGHVESMFALGKIFNCHGDKGNMEESFFWYKKSAEQGLVKAMFALGGMYENGIGVQQDKEEAERWYAMGADKGDNNCKLKLGRIYELNNEKEKARIIYEEIARSVAVPPFFLPVLLFGRAGFPLYGFMTDVMKYTDDNKASDMGRRAYAYEKGIGGVKRDMQKSIEWYKKAAQAGDTYSLFYLGNMYSQGDYHDDEKAFECFRKAAIIGCRKKQN
ncbi:tetratricopeptide repeat protein [Selenomonas sp. KH1T6]|uniref:tetratricopeptide repeat protein n=1 Tax=Selenomonas sp. KH1T6 TaxID=3158784 RepID=UPI0008A7D0E0|nr:hypothetical protein SAMN05216583_1053 [Selenomonas ruminantium]